MFLQRKSGCLFVTAFTLLVLFAGNADAATDAAFTLPEKVTFNAHIRPIMSNTCFACHGPDEEDNPSELRLDSAEAAYGILPSSDEEVAIKPGNTSQSAVFARIMHEDPDMRMPPAEFRHELTPREKALFGRWIEQGAKYETHWAYAPLVRPELPELAKYEDLPSNAIDRFILARLEAEGIEPSPVATKSELLRRLSLDLIGLPPTPDELGEFLKDESPDAYQKQVERLLASPHFGERMAAPWLDIVRFADTVGFHGDQNQRVFSYRDYVIRAFNENMPYDQFTREQLAGDLLEAPTDGQLAATGLVRLGMMTREGGAQPKEYLAKYAADRVRMIGTAFLGSTLGCCECHNHKFDPFATKDFYALGAFFDDLQQWGVYSDYGYSPNADLKGFNNDYPFPPELRLRSESLNVRIDWLQHKADIAISAEVSEEIDDTETYQRWLSHAAELARSYPDGYLPIAVSDSATASEKTSSQSLDDGSVLVEGPVQQKDVITLTGETSSPMPINAIRLEVIPDEKHNGNVGRGDNGRFNIMLSVSVHDGDKSTPLGIAWAQADRSAPHGYKNGASSATLDLKKPWKSGPERWQLPKDEAKLKHTAVYHLSKPLELTDTQKLVVKIVSSEVGRVRLSVTPFADAIPGRPALRKQVLSALTAESMPPAGSAALLSAHYRATTPPDQQFAVAKHYREQIIECRAGYAHTLIAQPLPKEKYRVSRVLPRGNWQDESHEPLTPAVPHFLPQPEAASQRRLTRLDLAEWITSPQNPVAPRHMVNRLWAQFFGTGLSNKLDDLGNQGEWPSHPSLLDWLASEFREGSNLARGQDVPGLDFASPWDVKHIVRLIVTSRTYQQRAAFRTDLSEIDPYNRLLAQQSARRMSAEIIRDNALSIAGLLEAEVIGGPSVMPYQPEGYYVNLNFPVRSYQPAKNDEQYRRGVYMHVQRTFLHPMLANFDAVARDECTAGRTQSNSPQQALTLLNDPTFVEASRAMAGRVLREAPKPNDFAAVLDQAFTLALSRPPSDEEHETLHRFYKQQLNYYQANPKEAEALHGVGLKRLKLTLPAPQQAAWTQVCRAILNMHEVITRY
ncbi:PSD1 and planctomycete cytochrome C domain-containing protein [Adhaeretor mobilis]|uniref:Planctomycete cytochrome C n=1 Tax=Adhaeretor mobilis TaxID=1930276 RepID=A0A517MPF9_9BACT|nr:PSD1 and planctomycete cytochrome C domain-containing protein [Adhaeretor mobilis]QDS96759.1 Planctomycete cytochrome C [Adhaeretor mobilis]